LVQVGGENNLEVLGSLGQLYMFILLVLLFMGSGFALWSFINHLIEPNTSKTKPASQQININKERKILGGFNMANNGWFKLAIFSFVGILISMVVLGVMSSNVMQGNVNGNMQMQGNMPMNNNMQMQGNMPMNNNMQMQGNMPMNNNMQMQGNMPMNNNMQMQGNMPMNNNMQMQGNMPMNNSMPVQYNMNGNAQMQNDPNAMMMQQLYQMQQQMMQIQQQMQQMQQTNNSNSGSMPSGGGMSMM
jgi:hypothetical protein